MKEKKLRLPLDIQLFAGESDDKLKKHMQELENLTSGNSHDAVSFAGKGLDLLKSMLGLSKKAGDAGEMNADEDPDDAADTNEDQGDAENASKIKKSIRNGGDVEDADEDPDDPADTGNDASGGSIITNKGKKIPKSGSAAVKKSYEFDEAHFEKSFEETFEDVLDASDAMADLAKSVKLIGNAHNSNVALFKSISSQQLKLAGAIGELLKSQAAIAAELEQLKKQPVTSPATGFITMQKKADNGDASSEVKLAKSEIQDVIVEAMNNGHEEAPMLLKKLGVLHRANEIQYFVDNVLPSDLREKL